MLNLCFYLNISHYDLFIFILYSQIVEIEELRCKYTLLESESQATINKLQSKVVELNLQLKQQSTYSSMIGSIFGLNLWKATTMPDVVDLVLEQVKQYSLELSSYNV